MEPESLFWAEDSSHLAASEQGFILHLSPDFQDVPKLPIRRDTDFSIYTFLT